jgi:hypothetical protein
MFHPGRCHGVVAINCSAGSSMGRFLDRLKASSAHLQDALVLDVHCTRVQLQAEAVIHNDI